MYKKITNKKKKIKYINGFVVTVMKITDNKKWKTIKNGKSALNKSANLGSTTNVKINLFITMLCKMTIYEYNNVKIVFKTAK